MIEDSERARPVIVQPPALPTRYVLVACTFLLSVLLYVDRACISVAKGDIVSGFGLTDAQFGWIGSAFALGYALFQVPAGLLADRLGPRILLASVVSVWSMFVALTGAAWNYVSMLLFRFLFGAGEAGAFPGIARAVFPWVPMQERGIVNGLNFSGSRVGAAVAMPIVAWMIGQVGWRASFGILAGIGFLCAAGWYLWFRNDPSEHKGVGAAELGYILENRQKLSASTERKRLSAGVLLSSRNMWLLMFQYFASNFTFYFCLIWAFSYLKETFRLDLSQAGLLAALPFLGGAAGNWFSGWLIDRIYRQGRWPRSRRVPAMIGFALATLGLGAFILMRHPLAAVVFLTVAIFGADMTLSPSWSTCIDIGKQHAGTISGTMNMAGNIGSVITSLAFPYLKAWTGSTDTYFLLAAILNLLAIGTWLLIRPQKPVEEY
jgi:ACS family glucarate transporter-like MFS transporter